MNTYLQNKFEIFLRDIFKLINHKVPYFIRWIEKYLEFVQKVEYNSESSLSNNDKLKFLEKFLQRLSSMYPDCQVDQPPVSGRSSCKVLSVISRKKQIF